MTIKEFSHKHALVFFWATIILAVLLAVTSAGRMHSERGRMMMKGGNYGGGQRMMNRQDGRAMMNGQQGQPMDANQMDGSVQGQAQVEVQPTDASAPMNAPAMTR